MANSFLLIEQYLSFWEKLLVLRLLRLWTDIRLELYHPCTLISQTLEMWYYLTLKFKYIYTHASSSNFTMKFYHLLNYDYSISSNPVVKFELMFYLEHLLIQGEEFDVFYHLPKHV